MKIFFILSLLFANLGPNSLAQVHVNKGPVFLLPTLDKQHYIVSQDALLATYVAWRGTTSIHDDLRKRQILKKVKNDLLLKDTVLTPPLDTTENFLKFGYKTNGSDYYDWSFVGTSYGYCHGITLVTRQFLYHAIFKPDLKLDFTYANHPKKWMKFYKTRVDQIMRGFPTEIPGFANLVDFSLSPIQEYLQRHAADQWAINTARYPIYKDVYYKHWKPSTKETFAQFSNEIKNYLSRNFYPRVVLGPPFYKPTDPHVVMVLGIEERPNENEQCARITYLNVGMKNGAEIEKLTYCSGYHVWLPDDEILNYYDFAIHNKINRSKN